MSSHHVFLWSAGEREHAAGRRASLERDVERRLMCSGEKFDFPNGLERTATAAFESDPFKAAPVLGCVGKARL